MDQASLRMGQVEGILLCLLPCAFWFALVLLIPVPGFGLAAGRFRSSWPGTVSSLSASQLRYIQALTRYPDILQLA